MRSRRSTNRVWSLAPLVALALVLPSVAAAPAAGAAARTSPRTRAPLDGAQAAALSQHADNRVIVVFKDQVSNLPDSPRNAAQRSAAIAGVQGPVLSELRQVHAGRVAALKLVNAVTATVSAGEEARLSANPAVAEVVKDEPIPLVSGINRSGRPGRDLAASPRCPAPARPTAGAARPRSPRGHPRRLPDRQGAPPPRPSATPGPGSRWRSSPTASTSNDPDFIRADGQRSSSTTRISAARGRRRPPTGARPSSTPAPSPPRAGHLQRRQLRPRPRPAL